jgi:hypothetical protein
MRGETMALPDWLTNEDAQDLRDRIPDDRICEECGLPMWVCLVVPAEAIRRGGIRQNLAQVEAEARLALEGEAT